MLTHHYKLNKCCIVPYVIANAGSYADKDNIENRSAPLQYAYYGTMVELL